MNSLNTHSFILYLWIFLFPISNVWWYYFGFSFNWGKGPSYLFYASDVVKFCSKIDQNGVEFYYLGSYKTLHIFYMYLWYVSLRELNLNLYLNPDPVYTHCVHRRTTLWLKKLPQITTKRLKSLVLVYTCV